MDLIDTTGSGDVDTSTVRTTEATTDREIVGLTGRLLRLPDTWNNPTGEWHLGIKAEFELLPTAVTSRLQVHVYIYMCVCMCEYTCILCLCEYVRYLSKMKAQKCKPLAQWIGTHMSMQSVTLYSHIDINTCTSLEKAHMLIESLPTVCNGEKMAKRGHRDWVD